MTDCVFCAIVAGDIPAEVVATTDNVVAFRDIAPKAPLHVLVVPRLHVATVGELAHTAPDLVAELVTMAQQIAREHADGDFRLTFNTGASAGQTVFHAHGHVLGGRVLEGEGA